MATIRNDGCEFGFPDWVPVAAQNYIAHTERGLSIRALARARKCHASTVLRQVRRLESRRDDPLVDDALRRLSSGADAGAMAEEVYEMKHVTFPTSDDAANPVLGVADEEVKREGGRVLEALSVAGTGLVAGRSLNMAVVVRTGDGGNAEPVERVGRDIVQAMAVREWIVSAGGDAPVMRYKITNAGRAALKEMTAAPTKSHYRGASISIAPGMAEAAAGFVFDGGWESLDEAEGWRERQARVLAGDTPLMGLARRRDKDGAPFLSREMVDAGERLRQDYELAERARTGAIDWQACLDGTPFGDRAEGAQAQAAGARVAEALVDLGAGLGDVALRCCCYLDGLEQAERDLCWAARSGKIVLRIALDRLHRHYEEKYGRFGPMIG